MDEQFGQGRTDTRTFRDLRPHQLHEHRVPADFEEVVEYPDLVEFEHIAPDVGEYPLGPGDWGLADAHRLTPRPCPLS
nr:hypothetical protein [Streptomyces sp. NRRL S-495]